MTDLDTLLQDFSYLKSLQSKNVAPKKVPKKLLLADPTVVHIMRAEFNRTSECIFERIYNRPIGYRCLKDCFEEKNYAASNPVPKACIAFLDEVKVLYADKATAALAKAKQIFETHIQNPLLKPLWAAHPELLTDFDRRLKRLEQNANKHPDLFINTKDMFTPFVPVARDHLSGKPWQDFLASPSYIRYCQWKHLERNMEISENDFDVHRIIGRGGFGEVYPCRKRDTGAVFAMKKLDKKWLKLKHQESSAVHERNMLAEMNSRFVTNLKYAFQDKNTLFLILDLMEGGDLHYHLRRKKTFSEWETKFYAAEIIMGLTHIHSRKMIYRDLKPANVLLDGEGHARISDLGLVRDISKGLPTSECGTVGYMAPEVIMPDVEYDQTSDWFSLGICIYQFLTGHTPFRGGDGHSKKDINRAVLEDEPKYPDNMPPLAKDLISKLLIKDPTKRLGHGPRGASDVRKHPFFADLDWQALVDHKLEPAIKPFHGQVNARDVYDIDRFDDRDTRGVIVTAEDYAKYYAKFDHIMSHQWQEEVLNSVYNLVSADADKEEAKRATRRARRSRNSTSDGASPEADPQPLMVGYMKKLGGAFGRSWRRKFVTLTPDQLLWSSDEGTQDIKSILLADVTSVEMRDNPRCIVIKHKDQTLQFMAEAKLDHGIWFQFLEDAVRLAKGGSSLWASTYQKKRLSLSSDDSDHEQLRADAVNVTDELGASTAGGAVSRQTSIAQNQTTAAAASAAQQPTSHTVQEEGEEEGHRSFGGEGDNVLDDVAPEDPPPADDVFASAEASPDARATE